MFYSSSTALAIATAINAERVAEAEHARLLNRARRRRRHAKADAGSRVPSRWATIPADEYGS